MARFRVSLKKNPTLREGEEGVELVSQNMKQTVIEENCDFATLMDKVRGKFKLVADQEVSRIGYRCPVDYNPLKYEVIRIEDDDDVQQMIDSHRHLTSVVRSIELAVFVDVHRGSPQIFMPEQVPTTVPSTSHMVGGMFDAEAFHPDLGQLNLCSNLGESSQILPPPVSLDEDGDVPLELTHRAIYDDEDAFVEEDAAQMNDLESADDEDGEEEDDEEGEEEDDEEGEETPLPSTMFEHSADAFLREVNADGLDDPEFPDIHEMLTFQVDQELQVGMIFENKYQLTIAVKLYHIKKNQSFHVIKSSEQYLDVRCKKYGNGCEWKLRAYMTKYSGT